jgi:hypothetical protein
LSVVCRFNEVRLYEMERVVGNERASKVTSAAAPFERKLDTIGVRPP